VANRIPLTFHSMNLFEILVKLEDFILKIENLRTKSKLD
jgi:hypothetical protein